jgi:4-hydroxyphenylpyruvate dioxygenase-like putative hemolysin
VLVVRGTDSDAGVQHVALNTRNIINAVNMLRKRGVKFLTIPATYYKNLRERVRSQRAGRVRALKRSAFRLQSLL